jgi:hypothetical protein
MAAKATTKQGKAVAAREGVNDRQRRFCEFIMRGLAAGRAYEAAGYEASGDAADVQASKLLRNAKVAKYLDGLRQEAKASAGRDRDDMLSKLWEIVETPVGKLNENHPLAQEFRFDENGLAVKMPSKLGALKQLCAVMGWNKPQEVKVDASEAFADMLKRIRAKRK